MRAAAIVVLQMSGCPLHSTEIIKRAVKAGLIKPKGKTPDHSLQAVIWRDMHANQDSPFVAVGGPGPRLRKYWLKSEM